MANILIVDHDPAVQIATRLLLERAGHHVTVAGDGHTGLAVLEAGRPSPMTGTALPHHERTFGVIPDLAQSST